MGLYKTWNYVYHVWYICTGEFWLPLASASLSKPFGLARVLAADQKHLWLLWSVFTPNHLAAFDTSCHFQWSTFFSCLQGHPVILMFLFPAVSFSVSFPESSSFSTFFFFLVQTHSLAELILTDAFKYHLCWFPSFVSAAQTSLSLQPAC